MFPSIFLPAIPTISPTGSATKKTLAAAPQYTTTMGKVTRSSSSSSAYPRRRSSIGGGGGKQIDKMLQDYEVEFMDMGYEDQHSYPRMLTTTMTPMKMTRRSSSGSISMRSSSSPHSSTEKQRRASIKAILEDETLPPMEKRRSIQHLMDGRRQSLTNSSSCHSTFTYSTSSCTSSSCVSPSSNYYSYYGQQQSRSGGSPSYYCEDPDPYQYISNNSNISSNGSKNSMEYYDYGDNNDDDDGDSSESRDPYDYCVEIQPSCSSETRRLEYARPPCDHYKRNCTVIAPCCQMAFGCRLCHDDCPVLPPKRPSTKSPHHLTRSCHRSSSLASSYTCMTSTTTATATLPDPIETTTHRIDRFAIKEIICRTCFTRQSSKTNHCVGCGAQFAEYHCSICNLWMSNEERPFHCGDCGVCRVGGAEHFRHCHDCGRCIGRSLYNGHDCNKQKNTPRKAVNCPVCHEDLLHHPTRLASHEMPCGHAIHWDCFRQLAARDSRCPVCHKTAETRERMMPTWTALEDSIALQPMAPEQMQVVHLTCVDCEKESQHQPWHFLGVQCPHCRSFNTIVEKTVLSGTKAHQFLQEEQRKRLQENLSNGNGGVNGGSSRNVLRTRMYRRRSMI